jgi:hypothetical protein
MWREVMITDQKNAGMQQIMGKQELTHNLPKKNLTEGQWVGVCKKSR